MHPKFDNMAIMVIVSQMWSSKANEVLKEVLVLLKIG